MKEDKVQNIIVPAAIILCGIVFVPAAYDRVIAVRHIILAVAALMLLWFTKPKVGPVHLLAGGYFAFTVISGVFATNKAEWVYWCCRAYLLVVALSLFEIDPRRLAKTMIVIGCIFILFFWYEYAQVQNPHKLRGLSMQRNYWSAANLFIIPFCWYAIDKKIWTKMAIFVGAMMVCNIFMLKTRSVILAVLIMGVVAFAACKDIRKYIIMAGLLAVVVLAMNWQKIGRRLSISHRVEYWTATMNMIAAHPMGVGAGNWLIEFPRWASGLSVKGAFMYVSFRQPHNDYLRVWSETGFGGIMCYLGMFAMALYTARKKVWLIAGIAAWMTVSFFSGIYSRPFATLCLILFIGGGGREIKRFLPAIRTVATVGMIFVVVVMAFRLRGDIWNKKLRGVKGWDTAIKMAVGDSVFNRITYTTLPWSWWRGRAYFEAGQKQLAIAEFEAAYRQNPYNIYVLNMAGVASGLRGDLVRSQRLLAEAVSICPEYGVAAVNLRVAEAKLKNGY